ncbi:MAG TPA: GNAT family N-acetyltransferase [Candidatus Limiplasma sp.]|nr:GNAT family N-acetyltransferase [Candidatus Limiplasma sp.]HRX08893.1 GNAT family N-acetyltransferase [Candidatus Limiplasma sp.]
MTITALEKASADDLDAISALLYGVVAHLNQSGIAQWDEVYPNKANVEKDLQNGELYMARTGGKIAGIITLNRESDPAYQTADWSYTGPDYRVVHRLCVAADMQGQGIGGQMMRLAEEMLINSGMQSVRLDAFSQNPHSLRLYEKLGYRVVGEAVWRKGLFYPMEKNIASVRPSAE